jgi:hypothetical protein
MQTDEAIDLSDSTRAGLARILEVILPGTRLQPPGVEVGAHLDLLDRVLRADPRLAGPVVAFGDRAAAAEPVTLADLVAWSETEFEQVIFALNAAYYMSPAVRGAIGYPGQERRPIALATPDQICSDELIEPVIARGSIYVPAGELAEFQAGTTSSWLTGHAISKPPAARLSAPPLGTKPEKPPEVVHLTITNRVCQR